MVKNTHIWNDSWLPREAVMRPIVQTQSVLVIVSHLIDPANRAWRNQALEDHMIAHKIDDSAYAICGWV